MRVGSYAEFARVTAEVLGELATHQSGGQAGCERGSG